MDIRAGASCTQSADFRRPLPTIVQPGSLRSRQRLPLRLAGCSLLSGPALSACVPTTSPAGWWANDLRSLRRLPATLRQENELPRLRITWVKDGCQVFPQTSIIGCMGSWGHGTHGWRRAQLYGDGYFGIPGFACQRYRNGPDLIESGSLALSKRSLVAVEHCTCDALDL